MEKKKDVKKKKVMRNRIFAGAVLFTMLVPSTIAVVNTVKSARISEQEPVQVEQVAPVNQKKSIMELDKEGE